MSPTGRIAHLNDRWLDRFHEFGKGEPPSRKLGLLIRTALVADPGKTLVWCDWSAIEARVLPWLANSRGAEAVLDIFRTNDVDPSLPDIYKITAGQLLEKDPREVTDDERQAYGKVPTLSLGFGGALGALIAMSINYGVYLDTATGLRVVEGWRANNRWAPQFWGRHDKHGSYGLWGAALSALDDPNTIYEAGRVAYVYDPDYLGGTLFCALPGGRLLSYPTIRWRRVEQEFPKGSGKVIEKDVLAFRKGYGWSGLWYGKLAENVTQATAASILRGTLKELEYGYCPVPDEEGYTDRYTDFMPVVGHTHDEIVTQPDADDAPFVAEQLHALMVRGFSWSAGLPLAAEATINWYYTKAKEPKK